MEEKAPDTLETLYYCGHYLYDYLMIKSTTHRLVLLFLFSCSSVLGEETNYHLQELLNKTTHLKVVGVGYADIDRVIRLDLINAQHFNELISGIQITEGDATVASCLCRVRTMLEFYSAEELVVSLMIQHDMCYVIPKTTQNWEQIKQLTELSEDFLFSWLDVHGISDPKTEKEDKISYQMKLQAAQVEWVAAMPDSLRPFWYEMKDRYSYSKERVADFDTALTEQFPSPENRILALLNWYGSGSKEWDHPHRHEDIADKMLRLYSAEQIINTIQTSDLLEQQFAGAARYACSVSFERARPNAMHLVRDEFLQKLKEYRAQQTHKYTQRLISDFIYCVNHLKETGELPL